jgi:hypothetical protein
VAQAYQRGITPTTRQCTNHAPICSRRDLSGRSTWKYTLISSLVNVEQLIHPHAMSFYLAIVSPLDSPLFELQFTTSRGAPSTQSNAFPTWSSFTGSNGSDLGPPPGSEGKIGGNLGLLSGTGSTRGGAGERHMMQMIVHKSLDSVDEVVDTTGSL